MQRQAFRIISRQGLEWIESVRLARLPWLFHAFSTRRGGVSPPPAAGLNLGFTDWDQRRNVAENRKRFLRAVNASRGLLATLKQIHSDRTYQVTRGPAGKLQYHPSGWSPAERSNASPPEGDALLTDEPEVVLSVRTADCMPVLLVDSRRRAIAAVHAGWRGLIEEVIDKAVAEMRRLFASRPFDLVAAVGSFIRPCCYEVGEEAVETFRRRFPNPEAFFRKRAPARTAVRGSPRRSSSARAAERSASRPASAIYLDLGAVAREQLQRAGVPPVNIRIAEFCTACRTDLFFSHRKERGQTGRMMSVVGIRRGM